MVYILNRDSFIHFIAVSALPPGMCGAQRGCVAQLPQVQGRLHWLHWDGHVRPTFDRGRSWEIRRLLRGMEFIGGSVTF